MSKSSTTSTNKSLPAKSAWSKGPPQTSAPSPRSQSPAPSAQSQPHLTHSRRPSALGQAIPIKDGVSVPRNNVGAAAAKTGSAVTFGSIDDASAPISSSPAAAPPTLKETIVKSFGTVPAASSNGKPTQPSRPAVSTASASTTATSSSSATPSSSAPPAKLDKKDIAKLFQSSSAPAPSPSETQSPAPRNANLPSQNQPPPTPTSSSQPSQFNPHYRTFVPGGSQPQGSGPNSGPSRSPVYQRPVPNGAGPRPQAPPNGAPSAGMSSPRLGPPHAQPGPPPAAPPVPGQPHMPTQMVWNGGYYYPPEYVPYGAWGYVPPGMPPQSAHPHPPPHMGPPPHMTPHPISPHNPPRTLQPGTPTMPHAAPNPVHPPHPPPPLSQPHSSINTMSSPPPTPSGGRLNVNSNAFVPQTSKRITLKNSEGKEVAIESLTKPTATPTTTVSSGQGTPYRQNSPASTPKRSRKVIGVDKKIARLRALSRKLFEAERATKKPRTNNASGPSDGNRAGRRADWVPNLTEDEKDILGKHGGCFKCRQFYAGHRWANCPNGYPTLKDYKKITPEMAADAKKKRDNTTNNASAAKGKAVAAVLPSDDFEYEDSSSEESGGQNTSGEILEENEDENEDDS